MSAEPLPTLEPERLNGLSREEYCYLTSRGRLTGHPHEIEIWFALRGRTLYFLSGGGEASDWVKNMRLNPEVTARLAGRTFSGRARFTLGEIEERNAREWLTGKYQGWRLGHRMSEWGRTALPVAVDLLEELE
jgi:hypothetical protein